MVEHLECFTIHLECDFEPYVPITNKILCNFAITKHESVDSLKKNTQEREIMIEECKQQWLLKFTYNESGDSFKKKTQERDRNDLYFNLSTLDDLSPQCPPPPLLSFTSRLCPLQRMYMWSFKIAEKGGFHENPDKNELLGRTFLVCTLTWMARIAPSLLDRTFVLHIDGAHSTKTNLLLHL